MSARDLWLKEFETLNGRSPNVNELLIAKEEGFDIERLRARYQAQSQEIESTESSSTESPSRYQTIAHSIVAEFPFRFVVEIIFISLSILLAIQSFTQQSSYVIPGVIALGIIIFLGGVIGKPVKSIKKDWMCMGLVLVLAFFVSIRGVFSNPYLVPSSSNDAQTYHGKEDPFNWTLEDLEEYTSIQPTVSKIIHDHGKPRGTEMWNESKWMAASLTTTYLSNDPNEEVVLDFSKDDDKRWVLTSIYAKLEPKEVKVEGDSYKFDWSKKEINQLVEMDYDDLYSVPSSVTTWDDVKKKHPEANQAYYEYTIEGDEFGFDDGPTYELTVDYSSGKEELTLEFLSNDGDDYYLVNADDGRYGY